jgi:hypothetical protein
MNHHRLPLALGIVSLFALAGCAEAPMAPVAAPHPIVNFAVDRETTRPSRFEETRASRFEFTPRFESFMRIANLARHGR